MRGREAGWEERDEALTKYLYNRMALKLGFGHVHILLIPRVAGYSLSFSIILGSHQPDLASAFVSLFHSHGHPRYLSCAYQPSSVHFGQCLEGDAIDFNYGIPTPPASPSSTPSESHLRLCLASRTRHSTRTYDKARQKITHRQDALMFCFVLVHVS